MQQLQVDPRWKRHVNRRNGKLVVASIYGLVLVILFIIGSPMVDMNLWLFVLAIGVIVGIAI